MRNVLILSAALSVLAGGQAFAHAQLVRADPKVGSTVDREPGRVSLWFTEAPRPAQSGVMLTGPGGRRALLSPLTADAADPRIVTAPLPPGLGPGRYQVEWRVLSGGGHRTQGDFAFTVKP